MLRNIRIVGVQIALVAMILRALLPAGWMPNPTGSAGDPFIVCTMDGAAYLAIGADGKPLKQQPDQNGGKSPDGCPFAAAPHLAPPMISAGVLPPSLTTFIETRTTRVKLGQVADSYTPQSPRAPPSFG
jgi:hypothetical protein